MWCFYKSVPFPFIKNLCFSCRLLLHLQQPPVPPSVSTMPRRGPAPKKMGPNKKALVAKPPAPATSSASPPTPPPPPPAPAQSSLGRRSLQSSSQRDVFDEMMGSEISSDNSSLEASPAAASPEVVRRKSPRFPSETTSSVGDAAVSDDSSLRESMATPDMTMQASTGSSRQQHRRKAPAPKKTQTAALKEIAKLQGHTKPVIPKLPFARLIREILMEYSHRDLRITPESLVCLQESAEIFAVQLMEDAYRCTLHRDRITLMPKDMKLAVMLRKDSVLI